MVKFVVLLFIVCLYSQSFLFADEKVSVEDNIMGSTFKTLAKAFVVMVDINKLKKNNIAKITKMDKEKFQKRYANVYIVIKDLPYQLQVKYGITENMDKEEAVKYIQSLDKKNIYEIIDLVPNKIIAEQFKQYLHKKKQAIQKSNLVEQINKFWNKIIEKANFSAYHSHSTIISKSSIGFLKSSL